MARIPINISTGKLKEESLIVGIDLGTTNSLIAKMDDGQPVAIADVGRGVIVPSLIHFGPGGTLQVGEDAREYLIADPHNTIYSVKRLMGKSYGDLGAHRQFFSYRILDDGTDSLVKIEVGGKYYTPVELSAYILKELKARAEHKLKTEVKQAVITVPAYFNDTQRQATRDAGKLAGLDVLRIVNEPTAAALAYGIGLSREEEKTIVVYDLGGGTFDVTVLRISGGIFEVLSTNGDTYLGGDDFDRLVVEHWLAQHKLDKDAILNHKEQGQTIRLAAEEAKKHLSQHDQYAAALQLGAQTLQLKLSKTEFEKIIGPLVQRTLHCCKQAMQDATLAVKEIDQVILVGGSTRVPLVKNSVGHYFGQTPNDSIDPDQAVALGAAIQADILAGNRRDLLLLDVTPLSLGIETGGGLMDVLIPRNSKIPTRVARQYTTQVDGQANMRISIYQGEREEVKHNRKLAEFDLRGIPAMPMGLPKVQVSFLIDADGILRVTAEELRSGVKQEISVKPQYGLTDQQVEQMLLESLTNAQADVEMRLQLEAAQEGKQLLYQSGRFAEKYKAIFSEAELAALAQHRDALQAALANGNRTGIHQAMDALDTYSKPLAERVMNNAVKAAMVGKDALSGA
jgi:molecular chaperone HscA